MMNRPLTCSWARILLLCLAGSLPLHAANSGNPGEDNFLVRSTRAYPTDDALRIDAEFGLRLSDAALEALHNGVPLIIEIVVELLRNRNWWWDRVDSTLTLRRQLQYHARAETYQLLDLDQHTQINFWSIDSALGAAGRLHGLLLATWDEMDKNATYSVRLQASLDIEALPLPLRPLAYISPSWHLSSEWYTWDLDL